MDICIGDRKYGLEDLISSLHFEAQMIEDKIETLSKAKMEKLAAAEAMKELRPLD